MFIYLESDINQKNKQILSDTSLMSFYFYSPCKNKYIMLNLLYQLLIPIFDTNF